MKDHQTYYLRGPSGMELYTLVVSLNPSLSLYVPPRPHNLTRSGSDMSRG